MKRAHGETVAQSFPAAKMKDALGIHCVPIDHWTEVGSLKNDEVHDAYVGSPPSWR